MPPSNSLQLEQDIIRKFQNASFGLNNIIYTVKCVGKPRPSSGECKTDIYVKGVDCKGNILELKISVKDKNTNEFQANKLKKEDASNYFGENWSDIIKKASLSISSLFENRPLIFARPKYPTKVNSITLGWKLEIASEPRALSAKIPLNNKEIREYVFKGSNLSEEKKNAKVEGVEIKNSGVADYLLFANKEEIKNKTANDIVSELIPIDKYTPSDIYLIFTANNYRTDEDSSDGPRSLAVQIEWSCTNGKLTPKFIYEDPLLKTGETDMKPLLLSALKSLGKSNPGEMCENDVSDKKFLYI